MIGRRFGIDTHEVPRRTKVVGCMMCGARTRHVYDHVEMVYKCEECEL